MPLAGSTLPSSPNCTSINLEPQSSYRSSHPPPYAGCPRHCGDGQKNWLQSNDSGREMRGEEGALGSSEKGRRGMVGFPCGSSPKDLFPSTTFNESMSMLESKPNAQPFTVVRDRPARKLEPLTRVEDGDTLPNAWVSI